MTELAARSWVEGGHGRSLCRCSPRTEPAERSGMDLAAVIEEFGAVIDKEVVAAVIEGAGGREWATRVMRCQEQRRTRRRGTS